MKACFQDTSFTPYWWEAAPRPAPVADEPPQTADVVIVGTGFTGVNAALTLSRAGRRVVGLDAGTIGFGASTRNGGQIGPGNQKFTVATLVDMFGRDKARALYDEGRDMLAYFKGLVRDEHIDCDLQECGRFRGAVTLRHYDANARELEAARHFAGVEGFVVAGKDVHDEIRSDAYVGGVVLSEDGAVHPARFHDGLLARARAAGAVFYGHMPVLGCRRDRGEFTVATAQGRIKAREVIVATNGYTGAWPSFLARRIVPVGSGIIATEPLGRERLEALLPRGRVYGETRRVFSYYRPSPDGTRLLFGGRCFDPHRDHPSTFTSIHRAMLQIFPELEEAGITHAWSGRVAMTRDQFPHTGVEQGLHYAMGYCGTGVTRSTYFGYKLALKLLGDPAGETRFDDLPFRRHAALAQSRLAVNTYVRWLAFRDKLDGLHTSTGAA